MLGLSSFGLDFEIKTFICKVAYWLYNNSGPLLIVGVSF